jgi:uncharacterized protein (DUF2147 family)
MKLARLPLIAIVLLTPILLASAVQAGAVEGEWLTPKDSAKVRIAPCGGKLCGTITWLKAAADKTGQPQRDMHNPDPALRERPVVGIAFLRDFRAASADHWAGGSIYDPSSGKTYDSRMSLLPDGTLKVEGCVTVFCKAQIWRPVH